MPNILHVRPKVARGVAVRINQVYDLAIPQGENLMYTLKEGGWLVTLEDGTQELLRDEAEVRERFEVLEEKEV
jgi:hypothetical protein